MVVADMKVFPIGDSPPLGYLPLLHTIDDSESCGACVCVAHAVLCVLKALCHPIGCDVIKHNQITSFFHNLFTHPFHIVSMS